VNRIKAMTSPEGPSTPGDIMPIGFDAFPLDEELFFYEGYDRRDED
jgi:hypothetical protein